MYCEGEWIKWIHWNELVSIVKELSRDKHLASQMDANQRAYLDLFGAEDETEVPMVDYFKLLFSHMDPSHKAWEHLDDSGKVLLLAKFLAGSGRISTDGL